MMHELAHALDGGYSAGADEKFMNCDGARRDCIDIEFGLQMYNLSSGKKRKMYMYHEAFADAVMGDILDNRMFKSSGREKSEQLQGILQKACSQLGTSKRYEEWSDSHPIDIDRAKALLQKPTILESLKCKNDDNIFYTSSCQEVN